MNLQQVTWAKFGLVFVVLVMAFVFVLTGKLEPVAMFAQSSELIGKLVIALGISGGLGAIAGGGSTGPGGGPLGMRRVPSPEIREAPAEGFDPRQHPIQRSMRGMVPGVVGGLVLCAICTMPLHCTPTAGQTAAVVQIEDAAACALRVYAEDKVRGLPYEQIVADVWAKCHLDRAGFEKQLAAHRYAEDLEHGAVDAGGAP